MREVVALEELEGRPTGIPAPEVDVRADADVEDVMLVGDAPLATAEVEEVLANIEVVVELDDADAEAEAVLPATALVPELDDVDEPEADVAVEVEVDVLELDEDEDPVWLSRDGMLANVMPAAAARTSLRAAAAPAVVRYPLTSLRSVQAPFSTLTATQVETSLQDRRQFSMVKVSLLLELGMTVPENDRSQFIV